MQSNNRSNTIVIHIGQMSVSRMNGSKDGCGGPNLLLHVIDMGQGMAVLLQQGK